MRKNLTTTLATELASKGKAITVHPGSILIPASTSNEDKAIITSKIATILGNKVIKFKNDYIDIIKQYKNIVEDKIRDFESKVSFFNKNLIPVSLPPLVRDLKQRGELSTNNDTILPSVGFDIKTPENIKELVFSNSEIYKTDLNMLLLGMTDDDLKKMWDMYFTNISSNNSYIIKLSTDGITIDIKKLVILYFIVKNIKDEPPVTIRTTTNTYRDVMGKYYRKLKILLDQSIRKFDSFDNTEKLIINIKDDKIYLNENVYNKFIEDNTVEVLLGMLLKSELTNENMYLKDIVINKDEYLDMWSKHVKREIVKVNNSKAVLYKNIYILSILKLVKDLPEEIKEDIYIDNLESRVTDYVLSTDTDKRLDVNFMVNNIITNLIIKDPMFKMFIDSMLKYSKQNKDLKPEEAASFAVYDLVLEYIINQTTITTLGR